jgi:ADP-heptose:LPS heptosyltransferase
LAEARRAEPDGPPRIAIAVTGGIGDFLVIARFLRDLERQVGALRFDIYCPRPELAQWACGRIPGFGQAHYDILFDAVRADYDLALRANQMLVLYRENLRWPVLRSAPALAAIVASLDRVRPKIDVFVVQHPYLDHFLASTAVFQGRSRRDYLHLLADIPYGGDALDVPADHAALARFGLSRGGYVTVHNGFDTDFVITGRRATKCYPHFGAVVEQLRAARPDLRFIQLGTVTSEPIAACDRNLIGRTSLAEAAGLLAGAALHLDNEGGLVHLAACLGTRAAVVFGPTPSSYFGYPGNINLEPPVCGGCWWMTRSWMDHCAKGYAEARCLTEQPPEEVARRAMVALRPSMVRAMTPQAGAALAPTVAEPFRP